MKRPFIAGNWKMNTTIREAMQLVAALKRGLQEIVSVDVAVCPPFVYLATIGDILRDDDTGWSPIKLGAQNMYWESKGAYTGEISPAMLSDLNCMYVILGHSERRAYFGETDEQINKKAKSALQAGLLPIICVGETLAQRDQGITYQVLQSQLAGCFTGLSSSQVEACTIAYEPVWAIGTGKTATPELAEDAHREIRKFLTQKYDESVAKVVRIQYGGSVQATNAKDLLAQPDIDGALVGGASLQVDSFCAIVRSALALTHGHK